MPTKINLRPMTKADIDAVYKLVQTTIKISYADVYPPEAIDYFVHHHSKDNILKDMERGYIVVAEANGRLMGTGTLIGSSVRRVFINPPDQGKGSGNLIVKALEQQAKSSGVNKLELSSSLKSREFWESNGFKLVKEFGLPVANDKHLIYYEMVKDLK
jgi:N-acetylglutamate synthase-like GNAT family acetyltransferase